MLCAVGPVAATAVRSSSCATRFVAGNEISAPSHPRRARHSRPKRGNVSHRPWPATIPANSFQHSFCGLPPYRRWRGFRRAVALTPERRSIPRILPISCRRARGSSASPPMIRGPAIVLRSYAGGSPVAFGVQFHWRMTTKHITQSPRRVRLEHSQEL